MALQDHPRLHAMFLEIQKEKEALQAKSQPFRDERDKLANEIRPVEDRIRQLNAQIKEIEHPKMAELDTELSAIAKATGGRSMSDGLGEPAGVDNGQLLGELAEAEA